MDGVLIQRHDRNQAGSSIIRTTTQRYSESLRAGGNVLLEGLGHEVLEQLERTDPLGPIGQDNVYLGQKQDGASPSQVRAVAEVWFAQNQRNEDSSPA